VVARQVAQRWSQSEAEEVVRQVAQRWSQSEAEEVVRQVAQRWSQSEAEEVVRQRLYLTAAREPRLAPGTVCIHSLRFSPSLPVAL